MTAQREFVGDLDMGTAFRIVTGLASRAREGGLPRARTGLALGPRGELLALPAERGLLWVEPGERVRFGLRVNATAAVSQLLELYLPLCLRPRAESLVIGHLGQSLDGQIAVESGASRYVTGPENMTHLHRLRALCDAVVVGASTVESDDPQLTTRLAEGTNPVRVVIDPERRVSPERRLFHDGTAPTWLVCSAAAPPRAFPRSVEVIEVASDSRVLSPQTIVSALAARGKRWLLIEGGGVTVSRFLSAGVLDRLHLTIAPVVLGRGVPGLSLPGLARLENALRPRARRFELGDDVLFDCALEPGKAFGHES